MTWAALLMVRWSAAGSSPQNKTGVNGKKGARTSAGAMNLLASAAENNEAYENTLTHAQLQQLQQHLLAQQFQVSMMDADATDQVVRVQWKLCNLTVLAQSVTCESASLLHRLWLDYSRPPPCAHTSALLYQDVISLCSVATYVHECLQYSLWRTSKARMHECTIGTVLDVPNVVKMDNLNGRQEGYTNWTLDSCSARGQLRMRLSLVSSQSLLWAVLHRD